MDGWMEGKNSGGGTRNGSGVRRGRGQGGQRPLARASAKFLPELRDRDRTNDLARGAAASSRLDGLSSPANALQRSVIFGAYHTLARCLQRALSLPLFGARLRAYHEPMAAADAAVAVRETFARVRQASVPVMDDINLVASLAVDDADGALAIERMLSRLQHLRDVLHAEASRPLLACLDYALFPPLLLLRHVASRPSSDGRGAWLSRNASLIRERSLAVVLAALQHLRPDDASSSSAEPVAPPAPGCFFALLDVLLLPFTPVAASSTATPSSSSSSATAASASTAAIDGSSFVHQHADEVLLSTVESIRLLFGSLPGVVPPCTWHDEPPDMSAANVDRSLELFARRASESASPEQQHQVRSAFAEYGEQLLSRTNVIGCIVCSMLELAKLHKNKRLRYEALFTLQLVLRCVAFASSLSTVATESDTDSDALVNHPSVLQAVLPGVSSGLARVTLGDFKQGHRVLCVAVSCWLDVLLLVLGDEQPLASAYRRQLARKQTSDALPSTSALARLRSMLDNDNDNGATHADDSSAPAAAGAASVSTTGAATLLEQWLASTGARLGTQLARVFATSVQRQRFQHWKTRLAFCNAAGIVLLRCNTVLSSSAPVMVEMLVQFLDDEYQQVASCCDSFLQVHLDLLSCTRISWSILNSPRPLSVHVRRSRERMPYNTNRFSSRP